MHLRRDDRVTRSSRQRHRDEKGGGAGRGAVRRRRRGAREWLEVTPCIMRRRGSLFCAVAPLSPLSHPTAAVSREVSSPTRPAPSGVAPVSCRRSSSSAGFEANSEGLTTPRGQKLAKACRGLVLSLPPSFPLARYTAILRALFTPRRLFGCLGEARRGETAKIYITRNWFPPTLLPATKFAVVSSRRPPPRQSARPRLLALDRNLSN